MPFVTVKIVPDALAADPEGKKAAISDGIVGAITAATGLAERDVQVVFEEVPARDWFVGRASVATMRAGKAQGRRLVPPA